MARADRILETSLGRDHPLRVGVLRTRGEDAWEDGQPAAAARFLREALRILGASFEAPHPSIPELRANLADLFVFEGRGVAGAKEAERAHQEAIDLFGSSSPLLGWTECARASAALEMGLPVGPILESSQRAVRQFQQAYGSEHPRLVRAWRQLARAALAAGSYQTSIKVSKRAREKAWGQKATAAESFPDLITSGRAQLAQGDLEGAAETAEELQRKARPGAPVPSWLLVKALELRGETRAAQGRYQEAEANLTRALKTLEGTRRADDPRLVRPVLALLSLQVERGDLAKASKLYGRARELVKSLPLTSPAWESLRRSEARASLLRSKPKVAAGPAAAALKAATARLGVDSPELVPFLNLRAAVHLDAKQPDGAVPLLRRAEALSVTRHRDDPHRIESRILLAEALLAGSDPTEGHRLLNEVRAENTPGMSSVHRIRRRADSLFARFPSAASSR
jgi:tetratricopeptide (TPR) repeat protein